MRIGVFGGSFDPIHYGHLHLAKDALVKAELDKVFFVPVRLQPFKQDRQAAPGKARCEMLKLGFEDLNLTDCFEVSDYELNKEGVSYTIDTLRMFKKSYPDSKIYFILGEDSAMKVQTWTCAEELLTDYSFIVGYRPGGNKDKLMNHLDLLIKQFGTEFILIDNKQFDISSTYIRDNVYNEDLPDNLVPEQIERYIEKNGLYR